MPDKTEFAIGDTVVFKEWDEMAEEYGLLEDTGSIDCRFIFTKEMRFLCGTEHVIRRISNDGHIMLSDDAADGYHISADMIRHIDESSPEDEVDIDGFLSLIQ